MTPNVSKHNQIPGKFRRAPYLPGPGTVKRKTRRFDIRRRVASLCDRHLSCSLHAHNVAKAAARISIHGIAGF